MVETIGQTRIFPAILGAAALFCAALVMPAAAQIVEGYDLSELPPELREKVRGNAGTVSLLVSGSTCTCARFAEDIRSVVNQPENWNSGGVRLVPFLGEGGLQNLKDTLFLRGINMAMVDESTLSVLKQSNPRASRTIDDKLRYITKLYNAELHILAKNDFKSIADLAGKTVNFDHKDSETDLIASRLFTALGIKVKIAHDDQRFALKRLLNGEVAAVALSTGAPQDLLARLNAGSGLHLLPIDEASLPGRNLRPLLDRYLPAELTHDLYPNLIPAGQTVPTLASRVLLVVYNWDEDHLRYKRNAQFTQEFFSRIDAFRDAARHPKWRDVNLAADVPGWTRFKPAQEWLDENRAPSAGKGQPIQAAASPGQQAAAPDAAVAPPSWAKAEAIGEGDREALFDQFQKFWETRDGKDKPR